MGKARLISLPREALDHAVGGFVQRADIGLHHGDGRDRGAQRGGIGQANQGDVLRNMFLELGQTLQKVGNVAVAVGDQGGDLFPFPVETVSQVSDILPQDDGVIGNVDALHRFAIARDGTEDFPGLQHLQQGGGGGRERKQRDFAVAQILQVIQRNLQGLGIVAQNGIRPFRLIADADRRNAVAA